MDPVAKIIQRFGGIRPMARILTRAAGRRVPPTTVQGWAQRGIIPASRQGDVLAAAKAEGLALGPEDFFDAAPEPRATGGASDGGYELLTVHEMGAADRMAMDGGTPGADLMEAAGRGAAQTIMDRFRPRPVVVLAGPGNNGGDGFVIARHLAEAGWRVRVALLGEEAALGGDAGLNARRWREMSGAIVPLSVGALRGAGIIIDALFGAGLTRALGGVAREAVEAAAASGLPVVAVDMPSGVDGDSGTVLGVAAPAVLTVTFFRKKPGHLLLPGKALAGEVVVIDIGIPAAVLDHIHSATSENAPGLWADDFPWPDINAHKYSRGHLVIGGGAAMTGAARLAARAGLRIGAGLVTIVCSPVAVPVYASAMPGVLTAPMERAGDFAAYLDDRRRRAVLLGPGYGVDRKTHAHVLTALALGKLVCLDADALTVFAGRSGELFAAIRANADAGGATVLTPHEGEFARLFPELSVLGKLSRARAAAAESNATVLIKGSDTVIAAPDGRAVINANAPPDLATGGSGDVLAGLIAGLLVQEVAPFKAAAMAAWIHGRAAADFGPGLIAEDLPDCLPGVLRGLRRGVF
jgi:NAD(P)H-hydrate epimerase